MEMLLSALCGCLNVLGRMVAKEQGLSIGRMAFSATGKLNPAGFLGRSTDVRAGFSEIEVAVDVESDEDPARLDAWLRTVESRCPVSDNLIDSTTVRVRLGD